MEPGTNGTSPLQPSDAFAKPLEGKEKPRTFRIESWAQSRRSP